MGDECSSCGRVAVVRGRIDLESGNGRDEEDAPAAIFDHPRHNLFTGSYAGHQVDLETRVPVGKTGPDRERRRVVDEDLNAADP
jgi:hypothetical protein